MPALPHLPERPTTSLCLDLAHGPRPHAPGAQLIAPDEKKRGDRSDRTTKTAARSASHRSERGGTNRVHQSSLPHRASLETCASALTVSLIGLPSWDNAA
jgi:hypothetical protein